MSESQAFFRELENFLPKYVPITPSYAHALLAFVISLSVGGYLATRKAQQQSDSQTGQTGQASGGESRLQYYALLGVAVLVSLFVADTTYNISWRLRNKVNRKHLVYQRWFR
ncbi:FirrV-1-A25 precursor [Feldmannia irregularis virus a]|uniref:FirrV-1-A25 n=1 Tax=Feldmannia irregularis virus a TaxID=231992 RepID=Q6XM62_9PHYC|nr:FirrV-1-A25 precursor [Feldmannia irregularis virus a]AAR26849.1 FirrV-1-A25 precursor [Feldmannia irregularis virus a]